MPLKPSDLPATARCDAAPAKINLCLHVTGQRADGYHLLDSLVVFASVGDRLHAWEGARGPALTISGPFGAGLPLGEGNLIIRAARSFGAAADGVAFHLEKHLPPASGIGGGSSDAAAALRLMAALKPEACPPDAQAVLALGADVPVCQSPRGLLRMEGVGERLTAQAPLPEVHLVLVNPRVEVSTPSVFKGLKSKENQSLAREIPRFFTAAELAAWLSGTRNDLEAPARAAEPVISKVLEALAGDEGCLLARMSGSGATCFGLYATGAEADGAARRITALAPQWWVAAGRVLA